FATEPPEGTELPTATMLPSPTLAPGKVRPPAVAGSWYPGTAGELTELVDSYLDEAERLDGEPIALIVPHAGYDYSGSIAAYGFKQMEGIPYDVAVIIAADHQAPLSNPISVWAEGGFETPLGTVAVNKGLAEKLIAADPQYISFDPAAHEGEHTLEIELPFLQRVCPTCSIVPILMGSDDDEAVKALATALLNVLPGHRAVIIASSDLSHYPSYDDALRVDEATLDAILTGDTTRVRQSIKETMAKGIPNLATCACGEAPILVTMKVAAGMGADTITLLTYSNSGDLPFGDPKQVVGYGAVMFWRYQPPDLTEEQKKTLLALARSTLEKNLKSNTIPPYNTNDPALTRHSGVFVTLTKNGELRGCIGRMWADLPLYQAVQEMAVQAATSDPRFPPMTSEELSQVKIEISVLSPLRRLTDLEQIKIGTHGLVIHKSGHQGVFLPQVPVEQGWDRNTYLDNLCLKAGLDESCWKDNPVLYSFTAIVLGQE
ncbi:MAG: AmmeMemoRadiSam system protein B, partial [Anaerolineales bacterium]|nr:AmmeMemoRadiSam system protein B [Anaerolineales bacterium]